MALKLSPSTFLGSFKPRPVSSQSPTGRPIRTGIWGLVFFIFSIISLIFLFFVFGFSDLPNPCCFTFILAPLLALPMTAGAWILWSIFVHFRPVPGLSIGHELGRFERTENEGWKFNKYLLSRKTSLDLESSSPHIMVVGGSQTGKSVTVKTVLTKLLKNKERGNIILDYHGEYGFLADKGFTVVDARHYDPMAPNYEGELGEHIVTDFVEAFLVAFETAGDVQLAILKNKLEANFSLQAALHSISVDAEAARSFTEKDRLTGIYLRLEKIVRYATGKNTLRQLAGKGRNIVFDFSGIRDRDAADFYAENILRRYMALLIEAGQPVNIFIDEAHRLNTKSLADRGCETTTVRIAREAGKFGGRLIIASQNLTDFPIGFSANFGNIVIFRIPTGSDIQVLERITGIGLGMLQPVMNGMQKGEALLIGPHNYYAQIKVAMPGKFPKPEPKVGDEVTVAEEPEAPLQPEPARVPSPVSSPTLVVGEPDKRTHPSTRPFASATEVLQVTPPPPGPTVSRSEEILRVLKEHGGALTATGLARRTGFPKPAVWRHLQTLSKNGKIIRYEECETPQGLEVFYEINDPHRSESGFHRVLVAKACEELERVGKVKVLNEWGKPDLVFNENVAIEVETGLKLNLDKFNRQVKKRFEEGYGRVIVVVINQKQGKRYEKALAEIKDVDVVKVTELAKSADMK